MVNNKRELTKLRIAVIQSYHKLAVKNYNYELIYDALTKIKDADLLIFPEMFLTGYMLGDKVYELAENVACSEKLNSIRKTAKEYSRAVIFGLPELDTEHRGWIYNSAVCIDTEGNILCYRKWHLANFGPFNDKRYFTAGKELPMFRPLPEVKLGVLICYDIFFPELAKFYALNGCDLIVCISASPTTTRRFFEQVVPARAIETTTFVVYSNLIGVEGELVYWGGSMVVDPRGKILRKGKYYKPDIVSVELDLDTIIKLARIHRPTLRDTRSELFTNILKSLATID